MTTADTGRDLEGLLDYLKRNRGFDFTGYKRATLQRRIEKRMRDVGVESFAEYRDRLEAEPDEFTHLFDTILINVTHFFRDPEAWEHLRTDALPRILARKGPLDPIRVWSAGCATGQEAYTLAIVLAEALGVERFRERVKIYATDVDHHALGVARQAVYDEHAVESIPPELLERYFVRQDARFAFDKEVRRCVIFGRNDLIHDAPISRIDLLVCRNTLMYFNASTQTKILARFHFALGEDGVLMLGRAETLLTHTGAFAPIDLKRRIFGKVPRLSLRDRLVLTATAGDVQAEGTAEAWAQIRLREAALDAAPTAQIVVDAAGTLALANERARSLFSLGAADAGRPLQDLEVSYRPVELRSLIEQSYAERRTVAVRDVLWRGSTGDDRWMDVQVLPLLENGGTVIGAAVSFADISHVRSLQIELETSRQDLETAYEELQATNEELETTNEELQSTVEELETTNEELQSTNEELETMNEELQATNEELQTINDELRLRSDDLDRANGFLASVFRSLKGGVVVVDRDMRILVWSAMSEDLWGLRADEVRNTQLMNLDIGLPVGELVPIVRGAIAGSRHDGSITVPATNRRGRQVLCKVTATPLVDAAGSPPRGAILQMETADTPAT
jgi:two-component system CheB/CheR fusion protein